MKLMHARLSASAWFNSASMRVFATVSTSTDSHKRASHIARSLLKSNLSAATSKCCVIGTSKLTSSEARPVARGPTNAPVASISPSASPLCAPPSRACAPSSLTPEPSRGISSAYTKCNNKRNTLGFMSRSVHTPSRPSRMAAPVRSMAANTLERDDKMSLCALNFSPSTSKVQSKSESGSCSNRTRCFPIVGYEGTLTLAAGSNFMFLFSAPPLVTTSSISYRITTTSFSRYPVPDPSKTDLRTNLR